jgi:hypothetical protein
MMKKILAVLVLAFSVNAKECKPNLSVSKVEDIAGSYVGTIHSVKLSKSRKGKCYFKVYGNKGYATIDANNGELLKFTKKRDN